jgi:Ca2+-binding EF-hand superfamily protein
VKSFRIFVALSAAACAAAAVAQTGPRTAPPTTGGPVPVARTDFIQTMDLEFKRMDADKNGTLTKKEIEDFQRAMAAFTAQRRNVVLFQALDKDKNGQLTPAEFAGLPMQMPQPNAAPVLAQTDGNRDGQITAVEYRAGKLQNFDRMDIDKDGVVSVAELKAAGLIK